MEPLVSVIVCVFNGEEFLASALASAFAQTHSNLEILVVDDGSTDGSAALAASAGDPRLRVLRQENRGAAGAMRTGLSNATGVYVAFLDQDDLWDPDSLAAHIALLEERPEIDLTFSWFRIIEADGRENGLRSQHHHGTIDLRRLLTDFVIGAQSNVVARRSAIDRAGGPDPAFRLLFNVDLSLRVALLAGGRPNIAAIPRELMSYRRHTAQLSRHHEAAYDEWLRVFDKLRTLAPRDVADLESRARSNLDRYRARGLYEEERYGEALRWLGQGFRDAPGAFLLDGRNWLTGAACLSGLVLPATLHRRLERLGGYARDART